MTFVFDERSPDSPYVDTIWHTQSDGSGTFTSFTSVAVSHWEMVVTKQYGVITFTARGPDTKATPAPVPAEAEFLGIKFKLGSYMPHLPVTNLVDNPVNLPDASSKSFYLHGSVWQFTDFENADTFVERLVREGLLVRDPLVESVLKGQPQPMTIRSVRRRFLRATGLTHGTVFQIERARQALALLERGVSILDTVDQAGYADQPHLTRSLKLYMGQTPAQILRINKPE